MRTTLTLGDDVAAALRDLSRERNVSLKHVVNEALREGLKHMPSSARRGKMRFRTEPLSLGRPYTGSVDHVEKVLSIAEGDWHK